MSSEAQSGSSRRRWRAPVAGAVAGLAVAAAIVGQSALADSGGGSGAPAKAKGPCAPLATHGPYGVKQRGTPAPGGVPHQFLDAVAQLVQAGTINAAQGRAVDAQIETGRMDPQQLVSSGVLTASQMAAVNDRLRAVKKSLAALQQQVSPAAAADCGNAGGKAGAVTAKAAAAAAMSKQAGAPAADGVPHQFLDAVARLVQAGTINAAQGRAVDAQIETGRMDPQQLVSSGVLTASQMAAVNDRLKAVKESLAPQPQVSPAAAAADCGKGAGSPPPS